MDEILCDVIQDLLPLYCDGVCSEESKKLVEKHLRNCETCTDLLQRMKTECQAVPAGGNEHEAAPLKKMARTWRRSLTRSFLKGVLIATLVLLIGGGAYFTLFVYQGSHVSPAQVAASAAMTPEGRVALRLQPQDGHCGGALTAQTDAEGNLYVSVARTLVKEKLPDGEEEVMIYGFDPAEKGYKAVYYGTPKDCTLLWKKGDTLPAADGGFR